MQAYGIECDNEFKKLPEEQKKQVLEEARKLFDNSKKRKKRQQQDEESEAETSIYQTPLFLAISFLPNISHNDIFSFLNF